MKETTFQKIIRKTGMKQTNCKCSLCKSQCKSPCIGTPEDMQAIKDKGLGHRLEQTKEYGPLITRPMFDTDKKSCTFFNFGLCELHDLGLKPTVGKLSHHTTTMANFNYKKSIHANVLKEWNK